MNFLKLIYKRYSVRQYMPDQITTELLEQVLEAARMAPTAANRQPFKLVVIHTAGKQEKLRQIYDREWFISAPIVICACGLPEQGWVRADGKSYLDVDVAIVMDHISLAAADLGLGTCWVASFDVQAVRQVLNLPDGVEPIALMSLGYPADTPGEKERKSLGELVSYESWDSTS